MFSSSSDLYDLFDAHAIKVKQTDENWRTFRDADFPHSNNKKKK